MLIPKRTKYRKQFRGRMKGRDRRGNTVTYGEYGLVAMEPSWITSGTYRYDTLHKTWRESMDKNIPGQAGNGKADRNPSGKR